MPSLRAHLFGGGLLLSAILSAGAPRLARADVDVVIGYETRSIGELEECG
jgi:hypothetical protein